MRTQGLGEDDRGWGKKDVQDNSSLKHEKGMRDGGGEFETKGKRERLEIQRERGVEREGEKEKEAVERERGREREKSKHLFKRNHMYSCPQTGYTPRVHCYMRSKKKKNPFYL